MRRRWLPMTAGVVFVLALFALIGVVLAVAERYTIPLGGASGAGTTNLSLTALILAAVVSDVLLAAMVALASYDRQRGDGISPLFWSMIAVKTALALTTNLYGLQAVDILAHGRPHWMALYQPEVRLFQSAALFSLPLALAAMIGVLLRGRRWSVQRLVIVYLSIGLATAAIVLAAVTLLTTQSVVP